MPWASKITTYLIKLLITGPLVLDSICNYWVTFCHLPNLNDLRRGAFQRFERKLVTYSVNYKLIYKAVHITFT